MIFKTELKKLAIKNIKVHTIPVEGNTEEKIINEANEKLIHNAPSKVMIFR